MPKWFTESQLTGERGETLVQLAALEMGFLYNRTGMDAGIDGEIEIRDPVTGAATNQIIRVQSKATNQAFPKETEEGFEFTCDKRDLEYWLSSNAPVLLVCSRPSSREAYWACIQDYFDTPEKKKARKVWFDKRQDQFDVSARDKIIGLARDRRAGLYINPVPRPETLYSNLLHVSQIPETIYSAETPYRKGGEFVARAKELGLWLPRSWALWDGRLWSFLDLSKDPWPSFCNVDTVKDYPAEGWAHSEDLDKRNQFSWLIRGYLDELLWQKGVRYDRELEHYHIMAPDDLRLIKKLNYRTHKGNPSEITVFQMHQWKSPTGATRYYYRHLAFMGQFEYLGGEWYLRILPTYRYTSDGRNVDRFYESHLSGMKKQEKNRAVLSQVELWAHVVSHGSADEGMFRKQVLLRFGKLLELEMPVGINDMVWRPKPDEDEDSGVVILFESHRRTA